MIQQRRDSRQAAQVARSQLGVRLGLALYAAIAAAIALRCLVLVFAFPATVWTVKAILTASSPLIVPLSPVPGAQRIIVGSATLADLTAALVLLAVPLLLLGRRRRT